MILNTLPFSWSRSVSRLHCGEYHRVLISFFSPKLASWAGEGFDDHIALPPAISSFSLSLRSLAPPSSALPVLPAPRARISPSLSPVLQFCAITIIVSSLPCELGIICLGFFFLLESRLFSHPLSNPSSVKPRVCECSNHRGTMA